jgi:hypothetical protein
MNLKSELFGELKKMSACNSYCIRLLGIGLNPIRVTKGAYQNAPFSFKTRVLPGFQNK